jgi:hypothetical protein
MANLKATTINDTGYLRLPIGNDAERPAGDPSVLGAVRINSTSGDLEYWSGFGWETNTIAFPYRQIISTAYVHGGYKSSAVWSNVNKCFTSTDTTINLGDGSIERGHNYQAGACSKDYAYTFGAGNGHVVASNYVIAYNMRTEQNMTDINRNMNHNRIRFGCAFQENEYAWIHGGGNSEIEEYNMTTKTHIGASGSSYTTANAWAMSHENFAILFTSNDNRNWTFATRTLTSRGGTTVSNHHQQKSVQSKHTYQWCGDNGSYSGGYTYRVTNMYTNTTSGTVNKPIGNCGEENYTMGQDHQYMLGQYNGLQNNLSHRWNYSTQTGFQLGSSGEPKGHAGMSSAVAAWTS